VFNLEMCRLKLHTEHSQEIIPDFSMKRDQTVVVTHVKAIPAGQFSHEMNQVSGAYCRHEFFCVC